MQSDSYTGSQGSDMKKRSNHRTGPDRGQVAVYIDNVHAGTFDSYSATIATRFNG